VPTKEEKQPLSVTHPELAKEADGWDPSSTTAGSNKTRRWKCSFGHQWESSPNSRCSKFKVTGCPICSGHRIEIGFNDLATTHPVIASQAIQLDTTTVSAGSRKVVKWKCQLGHTFESSVSARTSGRVNCGFCSGKKVLKGFNDLATKHPELAEQSFEWNPSEYTAGSGAKVTWICPQEHKWIASINSRTANKSGCPVCVNQKTLFGFNDLLTLRPDLALEANGWDPSKVTTGTGKKLEWKCSLGHIWVATPKSRTGELQTGCPVCKNKKLLRGFNDLEAMDPELAKEAFDWDPSYFIAGSAKKMFWKCSIGHIWSAKISQRFNQRTGCPICAGQTLLGGFNDLATTHPDMSKEAFGWDPKLYSPGAAIKKEWICPNNHKWKALISNRARLGSSCPTCANAGFDPNKEGYLYFLINNEWEMFQIGITNVPKNRLTRHKNLGWELLELRGPMDGHLTQQWETAMLRMLKAKGADLSNANVAGKFDGYSEAWSKSTFEVKSIKELMRLTEEFEEI